MRTRKIINQLNFISLALLGALSFSLCILIYQSVTAAVDHQSTLDTTDEIYPYDNWFAYGGDLQDRLVEALPTSDFGGVWINDDGRAQVGLVENSRTASTSRNIIFHEASGLVVPSSTRFTTQRDGSRVPIMATVDVSTDIDIITVEHPWETLMQVNESIHELVQKHLDPERGDWPIQAGIRTDLNKVEVHIPYKDQLTSRHSAVLTKVQEQYSNIVTFVETDTRGTTTACNWWYCDSPLRGGVYIKNNAGTHCTAGFVMRVGTTPFLLTAAHCGSGPWYSETYNYTSKAIGGVAYSAYTTFTPYQQVDAMLISINLSNWGVQRNIYTRAPISGNLVEGGVANPVYNENFPISSIRNSVVGDAVCISGGTTGGYGSAPQGGSCGRVRQLNVSFTAGGVTTITHRVWLCSRPGDSGAPIYDSANRAHGILRGIGYAAGNDVCSEYVYYTPMNKAIEGFNVRSSITVSLY